MISLKMEDAVAGYINAISFLFIKNFSGLTVQKTTRKPRSRLPSISEPQDQGVEGRDFCLLNRVKQRLELTTLKETSISERRIRISGVTESPDHSVNEKKYDQMVYNICKVKRNFEFAEMEPVLKFKISKTETTKGAVDSPSKSKISKFAQARSVFVSKKLSDEESSNSEPIPQSPKPNRVESVKLDEDVELPKLKLPSLELGPVMEPQLSNSTESVQMNNKQAAQNPFCMIKTFCRAKDRMPTIMIKHDITRRSRTYLDTPEPVSFGNPNKLDVIEYGVPRTRNHQKKVTAISSQAETHPSERKLVDTEKNPTLQSDQGQKKTRISNLKYFLNQNVISNRCLFSPAATPRGLNLGSQTERPKRADPYLSRTNLPHPAALKLDPLAFKKKVAHRQKGDYLIKSTV